MDHTPPRQNKTSGASSVGLAVAQNFSNVYGVLSGDAPLLVGSLNVVRRNHGDWLAVCKVTRIETMEKLIAFGAGRDYFDALQSLNKTIAAGHWKEDKPWPRKAP